jgi:hypothetical protein
MWRISLIFIVMSLSFAGIGYWYYNNSQAKIQVLQENNAKLKVASESNIKTINALIEQDRINSQRLAALDDKLKEAELYNTELRNILQRHNLTRLAEQRPGLIEKRINDATREVFNTITRNTSTR